MEEKRGEEGGGREGGREGGRRKGGIEVASYPGHVVGGKSGLVSTVCACALNPMISWGIVYQAFTNR